MSVPTFTIPAGGGSSTSSVYGSGAWLSTPVDITGWPDAAMTATIVNELKAEGVNVTGQVTGQQLAKAIAQLSHGDAAQRAVVAQVQQMLWYSGAYPSTVKSFTDLQPGTFSDADTKALASMITSAQQTGVPFGSYLNSSANYGQANGAIQAAQGSAATVIQPPNQITENAALYNAAQKLLGENPSPEQLANFQAYYTQVWLDGQKKAVLAQQQGAAGTNLPDAATLGQALSDQKNPPTAPTGSMLQAGQQRMIGQDAQAGQAGTAAGQAFNARMASDQTALGQMDSAANNLEQTGGVASVTAPPDVSNAAEDWLRQNDTSAVQAHDLSNVMDMLQTLTVGAAKVYGRDTFQQNRN